MLLRAATSASRFSRFTSPALALVALVATAARAHAEGSPPAAAGAASEACAAPRSGYATRAAAAAAMAPKGAKASLSAFAATPLRELRTGEATTLGALWTEQPVVLLFMRRLGCQMCRLSSKELWAVQPEIAAAGGRAVAFTFEEGFGKGSDADSTFEAGAYWPGPLYHVDRAVYDALFGAKTSLFDSGYGLLDSRAHAVIAKANAAGVKGNLLDGFKSGLQLGGQFVVARGGDVKLDHRQEFYGDDASVAELLDAIKAGAAA